MALEYIKQRARIRIFEAELAGKKNIEFDDFSDLPVANDVVAKLNKLVVDELTIRSGETEAEKAYLDDVIADTQTQIAALVSLQNAQQEGVRQETDLVARFKALADRGTVVQERLFDEKRALVMAQGKLFETTATLASVRRLLADFQHKRQGIDAARRLVLVKDLQDAGIAAAAAQARLAAVRLELNVKGGAGQPHFVIYRQDNDSRMRVDADENSDVQPGDIIEVSFGPDASIAVK